MSATTRRAALNAAARSAFAAVLALAAMTAPPLAHAGAQSAAACMDDYRLCVDNVDVVWHHAAQNAYGLGFTFPNGGIFIHRACQEEAQKRGLVDLLSDHTPLDAYMHPEAGRSFVETGVATLTYLDSVCVVDLKSGLVKSISGPAR